MFQTKVIEKNQNTIFFLLLSKIVLFNEEKYGTAGQAADDNIIGACALHAG
jgi:hypothetical protein